MSETETDGEGAELDLPALGSVPGLARIAVGAWYHGATWGIESALGATRRVARAATSGESAGELIDGARDDALTNLRKLLGVVEGDPEQSPMTDAFDAMVGDRGDRREPRPDNLASLRQRGAELLERAAEVSESADAVHPGFGRIVDQLAPDEARILKLLVNEGPQPIVYVNKAAPLGIGAREIARRLSLIGPEAGCLHPELVPAYLDNLVRLGLAAVRRDPVGDEQAYQVVEAQPDVVAAMDSVKGPVFSGQSSRRSVHITAFGKTFCQVCFPPEHLTGELNAIEVEPDGEEEEEEGRPSRPRWRSTTKAPTPASESGATR